MLFSPAGVMRLKTTATGKGKPVATPSRMYALGIGPLRFGGDPRALQASTSTALRFAVSKSGCGLMTAQDLFTQSRWGVVGHLVRGRLDWFAVTSPVAIPQTGVGTTATSTRSRGPATSGGVRLGDTVDLLLSRQGRATRTTAHGDGTTDYTFKEANRTLIARVDQLGVVIRMEWLSNGQGKHGSCA